MLDEVRVRPNLLIWVTRQARVSHREEARRVGEVVRSRGPGRTVAIGTTHIAEKLAATLNGGVLEVACRRDSQSAMPDHKVDIILVAHLGRELGAHKIIVDILLDIARLVPLGEIFIETSLDIWVLGRDLSILGSNIMRALVGTSHVGDIPDGVGARSVLERATGESIGVAFRMVGIAIEGRWSPVGACPHGRIELNARVRLPLILSLERIVGNSVDKADKPFEVDFGIVVGRAGRLERDIIGRGRDGDFGIDKLVAFAVGELVAPLVGIGEPRDLNLVLIDRRLEGSHRLGLRHAGKSGDIVIVLVGNHEEVTVAPVVGTVTVHTAAVTIARVAGDTAAADIDRTESVER